MKKIKILCDICKKEAYRSYKKLPIIFTADQEDGKSGCEPYFDYCDVDLCKEHSTYLMEGHYLFSNGVMGYNDYFFNSQKPKEEK